MLELLEPESPRQVAVCGIGIVELKIRRSQEAKSHKQPHLKRSSMSGGSVTVFFDTFTPGNDCEQTWAELGVSFPGEKRPIIEACLMFMDFAFQLGYHGAGTSSLSNIIFSKCPVAVFLVNQSYLLTRFP